MNILITGGAGYVGSELARYLLKKGHKIAILDNFRFGEEPIKDIKDKITIIKGDLIKLQKEFLLKGTDAVIHLAATSKEPTSLYNSKYTLELNYFATKRLADICKEQGVKFIYASSCSVYFSYSLPKIPDVDKEYWKLDKELPLMKETDVINPISPYSISKRASEEYLLEIADEKFHPVILRKGTIFGLSHRMRFDLVVNALVKTSFFNNKITVLKGIYRPLVDLQTVLRAYEKALKIDSTEIINIFDFNIRLIDLANKVADALQINPEITIKEVEVERNYRADDTKMKKFGIKAVRPFQDAVKEIQEFLKENPEDKPIYYNKNL